MVWIQNKSLKKLPKIGDKVRLTKDVTSFVGTLTKGSIVTITDCDAMRGFSYKDDKGHVVTEAGTDCELEEEK